MKRREMRVRIMKCLYQYILTNKDLDQLFEENLDMDDRDSIPFIVENTNETINNIDELRQEIVDNLTETWDFDRLGVIEQAILLMSAQELKRKETDKAVIINEAIEIAKLYCDEDAPKLINGVLDRL